MISTYGFETFWSPHPCGKCGLPDRRSLKMNRSNKKAIAIILGLVFVFFGLLHIYWPIHMILEDVKAGTVKGTGIDLAVLYPWGIELLSAPFALAELLYFIIFRKVKYLNVFNLVAFGAYILQVALFNVLLFLS